MLVLSRKIDESILIGDNIKLTVIKIKGGGVRLGIEAPSEIKVIREELASANQVNKQYRDKSALHPVWRSEVRQDSADTHIGSTADLLN